MFFLYLNIEHKTYAISDQKSVWGGRGGGASPPIATSLLLPPNTKIYNNGLPGLCIKQINKQIEKENMLSLTILWRIAGFIKNLRTNNFLGIFRILRLAGGLLWGQATRGWVRHSWGWSWHLWYSWWVIRYNFRYFYVIFRYSVGIYELLLEFWITAICIDNLCEMLE